MFDAVIVIIALSVLVALLAQRREPDVRERGRFEPFEPRVSQKKRRLMERRR